MKTKILIIEHDTNDIELIQNELKKGDVNYTAHTVGTKKEYEKALPIFQPDIILFNYTFPTFDGLTALKIRENLVPEIPFIFISESIDKENTDAFMKNGLTTFILKKRLFSLIDKMKRTLHEAELAKLNKLLKQSEVKRTEELAQNESNYKSLIESSMDAILLTVTDGQILMANAAACEIFKMTQDEICSSTRLDIVDGKDPRLQILLDERDHTGRAKGELTLKRKDGSKFPGEVTSIVYTDPYGQEKTSMTIKDLTEQKQAEQSLKASEAFSRGILDSLASHIAVINSEGTILKVNKSWNTFAQNNGGNSTDKFGEGANYFDVCDSKNTEDVSFKALKGIKDVLNGFTNEFYLEYPCPSPETERWFYMKVNKFESFETMVLIEHHDISERKMAEQKLSITTNALQRTLNDLNNILDSSLDVICCFDEEGRFVSVNAASEYIWGYKSHELIGKKYMDFVFHEDAEKTINAAAIIRSGEPVTIFENRYVHKDGSIVPVLWSSKWDEKDQLFYSLAKNATEKKKLEKAFEFERKRFYDLYTQAPSCMGILKGPNHVYELANDLYLQLIDKKKDIIGKTVKEILPELEAQGIFKFLDTVYKTGETFSANEMLVKFDFHGNGKLVDTYLNFIYQAHRDDDGDIDGILFFANDVTEQVLSRQKIEESVLRYTSLIEQAGDAICFIDSSMNIIEVNRYACEKLGYSKTEILQLSLDDFFLEEDLKANPLKIYLLKEGKTLRGERRIKRKNGSLIEVDLSAKMLNDGTFLIFIRDISEQKKAQQAVVESEKKYRQIVETAQEGIWLIDQNHQTTFVNNKMCEILEYAQEEMMGKDIYSFMDQEGKKIATKLMKRKKEGQPDQRHFKYISKSGKEIWTNVVANPLFDETGIYKGSLAMVTDITEIKKAQQTLKEKEKKYRYLFDNNPMPMWVIDIVTFKFLDVNKMTILQYGFSREEFLSMTALDIRPEKDKDDFKKLSDLSGINASNFNRGIWNHKKKNGTVIPVEIIAHEIIYEGVPARFILSNDITDRRKTELNLKKRNKELADYKYALDETSIIGITDRKGRILHANDNFCKISKYSKDELIGQDHRIISSGYHSAAYIRKLWETISSGKIWKGELKNKAKDGTFYWVDTTITPFLDEHGNPFQYLASRFDITASKKAELNLEKRNIELIKTNTELDRFVYSVSHDLRSPLTSILGLISFIEEESKETDTLEHVTMIRISINRLDEFIKNILSYSRNNRTGLEVDKIPLQKTIIDIVDSLHSMKEAKEIHFEIDIREHNPFYSDSLRFNTILVNLISNAIKYHKKEESGGYIKITGQSDPEKLVLTISDNGIGIAPAYHQKIFEMFFRLSGKTDGSGIGLYIVKDTVEILQGSIEIQSEEGTGTSFIITLKNLKP
ncbi:PAS domain S-box protein [uncultured Flavobacterium sp.]|uniref:PAS domain S-box protein n=1 Tax=uncultured Flavobacterium sp. TaxID=165435 RepID=UPI0030EE4867|tara:strand:- start:1723 stop:5895 length:4173 start_codon:yes stop_codon:yes gene_type:complete